MLATPRINPNAIDLLARHFNTHKKGLPEWLKNAREAYLRAQAPPGERHVIVHYASKAHPHPYLEVVDFVGISGADIEARYLEWANPDAAGHGLRPGEAEGGQGNGGKAYLRQMFAKGYFISVCDGLLSVVSFTDPMKYILDFVPDRLSGKDYAGDNPLLKDVRRAAGDWLEVRGLPRDHNITIVRGINPSRAIDPDRLLDEIQQFPHARETIRSCRVTYWEDKQEKCDFVLDEPELHPMFAEKIIIPIPGSLSLLGKAVPTARPPAFAAGVLEICVAAKPLVGQALSTWNRFDFHAVGPTVLGYVDTPQLPLRFPQYAKYVYGRCTLALLKDPGDDYEMQGRVTLNDGPLKGALYQFIAEQVDLRLEQLAKQAQSQGALKKRKNLEKLNKRLAAWMDERFPNVSGMGVAGDGTGRGRRRRKERKVEKHATPAVLNSPWKKS